MSTSRPNDRERDRHYVSSRDRDRYRDQDREHRRDRDDRLRSDRHRDDDRQDSKRSSHKSSKPSSSRRHHHDSSSKIFATIPIEIFGYSNNDNPFHTEILNKPFIWARRDRYREKLGLPVPDITPQYLREQALRMSENVLAVKERRLLFQIENDQNKRLAERTQRDIEFMKSHDFELEQAKNSLLQLYKQSEIRALSNNESPFHIFIKYVLFRLKLEKIDVLRQIGIAAGDSQYERDRHDHFITHLLEVNLFLDINDVIDSLSFDEAIHVYAGVSRMIDLSQKTLQFQAKQEKKIQQQQNQPSSNYQDPTMIKTTIDYLPIVCEGDLEYWTSLHYVLSREIELKFFQKLGFSSVHSYHLIMMCNPDAHLTFHKLSSQYKRYMNDDVTQMMERSESIQKKGQNFAQSEGLSVTAQAMVTTVIKQSKPIYDGLDGLHKIDHYVDPHTIGQSVAQTDQISDRDSARLREQQRIQELTEQCVPLEWYISTGSGINFDMEEVDGLYKAIHENPLNLSSIAQLRRNAEAQLNESPDGGDNKYAALWKGVLHELTFVEEKTKLHIFFRRLSLIRAAQLDTIAGKYHTQDIQHHQQLVEAQPKDGEGEPTGETFVGVDVPKQSPPTSRLPEDHLSAQDEAEFQKRQKDEADEVTLHTVDLSKYISSIASTMSSPRLITRRPRFISKVKTGFNWTKYNRSHYTSSNPPPRTVQGYRFEVFYPDLLDPSTKPTYTIINDSTDQDHCILKFSAGPPYEDIAFQIVKKEWNTNVSRGFRATFSKGIFTLVFNFKSVGYRR